MQCATGWLEVSMINLRDLSVRDVMTPAPECLQASCTLACAYELLASKELSGAPVLGDAGELLGVITLRDLVELAGGVFDADHETHDDERRRLPGQTLDQVITRGPVTCPDDATLVEACKLMVRQRLHRLVVTEFGVPVGLFSAIDAARAIACLSDTQRFALEALRNRDRTEDPEEVMQP